MSSNSRGNKDVNTLAESVYLSVDVTKMLIIGEQVLVIFLTLLVTMEKALYVENTLKFGFYWWSKVVDINHI